MTFDIEKIWFRIANEQGADFFQIRGKKFSYEVVGDYIDLSTTNQKIPKKHIVEALRLVPFENTVPLQNLRAPSYIYAILADKRIRKSDW